MKKVIITLLSFFVLSSPLMAKERGVKINGTLGKNHNSVVVKAEGSALLGENDTPNQARTNALLQAKRNAAESALTKITSFSTVKDFVLTEDIITAKAKADVTVLEQENLPTINNEYKVRIKAEVKIDESSEKDTKVINVDPEGPLKVFVWTDKKNYRAGDKLKFSILSNKDSYLVVNYVMADRTILQIFPNDYWNDNFVKGGETINIPSDKLKTFDFEVTEPFGTEKLVVYASSSKITKVTGDEPGTRGVKISEKRGFEEFSQAVIEVNTSK